MRRVNLIVAGRVQGVFYRAACAEQARAAGVAGWIHNTPDGLVEAEFEGPPDAVAAMVAWARLGPPGARVESVEVSERAPLGETAFRITG